MLGFEIQILDYRLDSLPGLRCLTSTPLVFIAGGYESLLKQLNLKIFLDKRRYNVYPDIYMITFYSIYFSIFLKKKKKKRIQLK